MLQELGIALTLDGWCGGFPYCDVTWDGMGRDGRCVIAGWCFYQDIMTGNFLSEWVVRWDGDDVFDEVSNVLTLLKLDEEEKSSLEKSLLLHLDDQCSGYYGIVTSGFR